MIWILALCLAQEKDNALQPLSKLAPSLNEKAAAFLKGGAPADAFQPWMVPGMDDEKVKTLRAELEKNQIQSLTAFGFEVEYYFYSEGKSVYRIRGYVIVDEGTASFVEVRGSKDGEPGSRVYELAKYKDDLAPFAESGEAVLKAVQAKDSALLPLADADKLVKMLPEKVHKEVRKDLEKGKKNLIVAFQELGELKVDEVRVKIDDASFLAKDSSGSVKGVFNCQIELRKDGKIEFELHGFKSFE